MIPLILLGLGLLPIIWFVFIVSALGGYCSLSQSAFNIIGGVIGGFFGWWTIFKFYYQTNIQKLFNPYHE